MRYILTLVFLLFMSCYMPRSNQGESQFSYEDLLKINPIAVMDQQTLLDPKLGELFQTDLLQGLVDRRVLYNNPMQGLSINYERIPYTASIVIDSNGGYVKLGFLLSQVVNNLRSQGISFKCYVSNAMSMAFYFMVTSCDYIILKKGGILMQHRIRTTDGNYSTRTKNLDMKMARNEARSLGLDTLEWLLFTRTNRDKVFTAEEIKKYKLIDKVME